MQWARAGVAILAAWVLSVSMVSAQGLTVKGDAKAWSEIEASLVKLHKLKAFRQKVSTAEGFITMAVVPPDKIHTTFPAAQGGAGMETIVVGGEVRMRQAGGRWSCMPPGMKPPAGYSVKTPEPGKISGEVAASRGSVVAIDGVQTQSYSYTLTSGGSATTSRIYIGVANGLPRRLQVLDAGGGISATIDYFDYDAAITIVLPACG